MTSENALDFWNFLVGKWKGVSKDQFGGKGEIITTASFTPELSGKYIMGHIESYRDGKLEKSSISMLFYDAKNVRFVRKTFFNHGFVNNEVEYETSPDEIRFTVVSEPVPQAFDGLQIRSYLRKVSDTEIIMGLEAAKPGGDYESYGDSALHKTG
jgi:hypothetical protein